MTTYTATDHAPIELDDQAVADLHSLSAITRTSTADLLADAVERLRQSLVPSARPVHQRGAPTARARRPKDAS